MGKTGVTEPHPENSVTELLFLVILQENPKVRTDLIRAVFRACDTNGDDWLGETEFRNIVGAPYGVVFWTQVAGADRSLHHPASSCIVLYRPM